MIRRAPSECVVRHARPTIQACDDRLAHRPRPVLFLILVLGAISQKFVYSGRISRTELNGEVLPEAGKKRVRPFPFHHQRFGTPLDKLWTLKRRLSR